MAKKSRRFFLPDDDYDPKLLPTDHEPTLAMMGIKINWKAYDTMIERCRVENKRKLSSTSKSP